MIFGEQPRFAFAARELKLILQGGVGIETDLVDRGQRFGGNVAGS